MIVGYSTGSPLAEEWKIDIENGMCNGPYLIRQPDQIGMTWNGEPEAITRLYKGFSPMLPFVLEKLGISKDKINELINSNALEIPMVISSMPIQDAIDLSNFLVDTTIKFSKYAPGPSTVGGPIEIAVITKHEGFKWVKRKHYYDIEINPKMEDDIC